jgi:hypothetical protein
LGIPLTEVGPETPHEALPEVQKALSPAPPISAAELVPAGRSRYKGVRKEDSLPARAGDLRHLDAGGAAEVASSPRLDPPFRAEEAGVPTPKVKY